MFHLGLYYKEKTPEIIMVFMMLQMDQISLQNCEEQKVILLVQQEEDIQQEDKEEIIKRGTKKRENQSKDTDIRNVRHPPKEKCFAG